MKEEVITKMFLERYQRLLNFETFQETFAKVGVIVWIMPDGYFTKGEICWRVFMSVDTGSVDLVKVNNVDSYYKSIFLEDDYGCYSSPHEAKSHAMKVAIEYCLENKIKFS